MDKKKILIVDDEPDIVESLEHKLTRAGYQVETASDGLELMKRVRLLMPDLILLDISMSGMDGIQAKKQLNNDSETSGIPVIFVTGKSSPEDKVEGLSLGVDDYITKPFNFEELLARISAILNRRKHYEELSMIDGLTGLHNTYFFKKQISLFFNMAKVYGQMFALILIDLDDLKKLNDTYGHVVGDLALQKLSAILKRILRRSDVVTRYGGDEFAILLPGCDAEGAEIAMKKVRADVKNERIEVESEADSKEIGFSVSMGIVDYNDQFSHETQLFAAVDAKMYKDKKNRQK